MSTSLEGGKQRRVTTLKKILSAGKGPLPDYRKDTKAIFHYEIFLPPKQTGPSGGGQQELEEDGEEARRRIFPEDRSLYACIDSTKVPPPNGYGKPLELVLGKKFQLPLFEECIRTMLADEISQFDVYDPRELVTLPLVSKKLRDIARAELDPVFARQYEHAQRHQCAATISELGYAELDQLLKEGPRPARVVLHLLAVLHPEEYAVDNWQLDEQQRSAQVDRLRAEGNRLFGQKDNAAAIDKYREALTLLDQLLLREKPGEPEWTELDGRNVPLYSNLAQCYLNIGNWYDAANCADEALKREPTNGKALWRRARARMQTWDLDEAEADLRRLTELGQEAALVEASRRELEAKRAEKRAEEQKAYRAMFKGISGSANDDGDDGNQQKEQQ